VSERVKFHIWSDTPHKLEQCLVYPSGDISYRVHSNV
jgi:hypothetical protein